MGTLRRLAGAVVIGLFVLRYALRPLGGTTALARLPREWSEAVLFLPLLALSGLVLVLAALAVRRGEGLPVGSDSQAPAQPSDREEQGFWAEEREKESVWAGESSTHEAQQTVPEQYRNHPAVSPDLFEERQSRDRIEEETPDARLSEHLAHLDNALGEEAREELDTLASVAGDESDRAVPARCPAEGCDAVWSGRTPLGIGTDRYDVLEDGRVVCLDCEEVYNPD